MKNCKLLSTHAYKGHILNKSIYPKDKEEISKLLKFFYAQVVGSLVYAMISIRPGIYYIVRLVSRYQSNPNNEN